MAPPVIVVDALWKRYGLPLPEFYYGWRERLLSKKRRRLSGADAQPEASSPEAVNPSSWALRDLSFEVGRGETLGLIGRNGAGKSTLLKVLAGVTPATRGRVSVAGRIFSMIELNAGLHRELTGRENVRLLGAIMGLSREAIDRRMPGIEQYCELGDWFDRPVWKYSSGMLARVGFAVAVNVDADVLLVDEVLAVGDLAFQRRCYDRIAELKKNGVTIVFVSHSMRQVERLCDRTILLEQGRLSLADTTAKVVDRYFADVMAGEYALAQESKAMAGVRIQAVEGVALAGVEVLDMDGAPCSNVLTGGGMRIRVKVRSSSPLDSPYVAVGFVSSDMLLVGAASNEFHASRGVGRLHDVTIDCVIDRLPLMPGIYSLRIKVRDRNTALLVSAEKAALVNVSAGQGMRVGLDRAGLVLIDADWKAQDPGSPDIVGTGDVL
ncbi:MAG: ABC transporter ATP-binding protein [Planctomycetes bacterium]|nr:ABC transporter ATP-binding protein [Planctomycetota bacterium]